LENGTWSGLVPDGCETIVGHECSGRIQRKES